MRWNSASCDEIGVIAKDYCLECKDSSDASVGVAIVSLITILPTITTDIQRSTVRGDMNCQKFMGIFTGVLGCVSTIAALSAYAGACFKNLPEEFNTHTIEYKYGPGFVCLLFATILKVFDIICHVIMPVEPFDEEEYWSIRNSNSNSNKATAKVVVEMTGISDKESKNSDKAQEGDVELGNVGVRNNYHHTDQSNTCVIDSKENNDMEEEEVCVSPMRNSNEHNDNIHSESN